jgi:VWFA-related protein
MRSRLVFALILCATAAASAQQPAQPTFRGGANYVRVDMFATLDGQPVEDLRQDEIDLLEDGSRQQIDTFEHVKVRPAGAQETRVEPASITESRQMAAEARARVLVIFLDTYHTQIEGSANMRLPLVRFLDRLLGQDDMVALMTPEMSANDLTFGRKTVVISNIMQNEWTWGRRARLSTDDDPIESLYETCFPNLGDTEGIATEMKDRRRERLTLDALEDLTIVLRGLREERKAVIAVSEGWRLFTENQRLARAPRGGGVPGTPRIGVDPGGRISRDPDQGRTRSVGVDMQQCDSDRTAFALMNSQLRVRELVDSANRANVSFYTVYPRGLAPFDSPIGPEKPPSPAQDRASLNARLDNLRELASNTDGMAIVNTNDIEGGLRRVVADLSSYYLLGYYSTNTRLDGRFRTITVRVKRPGVQVRARRGYRGLTADELLTTRDGGGGGASAAAASPVSVAVNPRATFRIRTSVWTPDPANASVWVAGELDYATRRDLAWTTGADAEVVVVAANGTEVVSTTAEVAAGEGAFSLRVPTEALASGEYAVRVRLRPKGSGLPVTDTTRLIVPAAGTLGEPVMLRRGPSTGPRHLVTADPRFTRSDRIRFEIPTSAPGTATARMLDRLGKPMQVPVQVSERADASGAFRWLVADAALAPLAAGDYGIEVALGDAKQVGSFKVVPW